MIQVLRAGHPGPAMSGAILLVVAAGALWLAGCGPKVYRGGEGTDKPEIDEPPMSLALDHKDIDYLAHQTTTAMFQSPFWTAKVRRAPEPPLVAVWPILNATTQHLEGQMTTLLTSIETALVSSGDARVVARNSQEALIAEVQLQQSDVFDPATAGRLGRQLGAKYFLTGRVTGVDERLEDSRRVQYRLFIQVVEVETGLVTFQNEASRTKLIKR